MFTSSSRRVGGNPNRWLLLAGAGLLALGFVLRLMMDIGRTGSTAAGTETAAEPAAETAAEPAAGTDTAAVKAAEPAAEKPAAESKAAEKTAANGVWTVQLGVFSTQDNASKVVERARALGYPAASAPVGTAGKYRVRVAGFATRTDAQAAADSLGRGLGLTPVVLR